MFSRVSTDLQILCVHRHYSLAISMCFSSHHWSPIGKPGRPLSHVYQPFPICRPLSNHVPFLWHPSWPIILVGLLFLLAYNLALLMGTISVIYTILPWPPCLVSIFHRKILDAHRYTICPWLRNTGLNHELWKCKEFSVPLCLHQLLDCSDTSYCCCIKSINSQSHLYLFLSSYLR